VIGSTFTYKWAGQLKHRHEFHSLALEPVTARREGQTVWEPQTAGIELKPIPDSPKPASSPAQRLVQMRALARLFSATLTNQRQEVSELRLVPQPLLRYESPPAGVLDGGIFSFALGTDPEVLLLVEVRGPEANPAWHYGFARYHYWQVSTELRGEPMWNAAADPLFSGDLLADPDDRRKPFVSFDPKKLNRRE
jgi:hypothetical protein